MIKTNNGSTKIEGNVPGVLSDYATITKAVYDLLTDEVGFDEDDAKLQIQHAFDFVFKTREEKMAEIDELLEGMPEGIGDLFKALAKALKKDDE